MSTELPLLEIINERERGDEERRREIHSRCVTIERACRAIGFGAGEGYERVATLVARVAGRGVLVRTATEMSEDPEVNLSVSQVRRAIDELARFGVLSVEKEQARQEGSVAKRGRRKLIYKLRVDNEGIAKALAELRNSHENAAVELTASSPHDRSTIAPQSPHDRRTIAPQSLHLQDPSYSNPLSQIPGPIPNGNSETDGPDQSCLKTFTADQVAASAERLFRGLGYNGDDGRTIWQVAAAFDAGLLSEHQIRDAARAACMMAKTNRLGYFRRVLAERCETDAEGLRRILSRVRMIGGFPSARPQKASPAVNVAFNAVPRAAPTARTSDAVAHETRMRLQQAFVLADRGP